jgi:three-Cys-motif partner protein
VQVRSSLDRTDAERKGATDQGEGIVQIPAQYQGREQSYLKHRVLEEYLLSWGHKLGSFAQHRRVRLCYVDGFAGPWQAKDAQLADTSISIGLDALEEAAATWKTKGYSIDLDAFFVEKEPRAFSALERFLNGRTGVVRTQAFRGEFGDHVEHIRQQLGTDAAFIFVDPTGWKGAAMHFIAPLLADAKQRDVLVNFMFNHINRFKDDERDFLRSQMRDFFGLGDRDLPEGLGEEDLFALYRKQLKQKCGITYAADLAIPHPTFERTKFRLVVGGNSPTVLEVFRDIEKKVMGAEAAKVRERAIAQVVEKKTKQMSLLEAPQTTDSHYEALHTHGLTLIPKTLVERLVRLGPVTFQDLWPAMLEEHHVTRVELGKLVWGMHQRGEIQLANVKPRERTANDVHLLSAKSDSKSKA